MPRRPPKAWTRKMLKRLRKQYPTFGKERIKTIMGGIWHKQYSESVKRRLVRTEKHNPMLKRCPYCSKRIAVEIKLYEVTGE